VGKEVLGRMFSVTGDPIDDKGAFSAASTIQYTAPRPALTNSARRPPCLKPE